MYRHGDLIIKPIKRLPKGLKVKKDNVIALGEATGHHHTLTLDLSVVNKAIEEDFAQSLKTYWDDLSKKVYFEAKQQVKLQHQEHNVIVIQPGIYEVGTEREFDYFTESINRVID